MAEKNESVLWLSTGDRIFLGVAAPLVGGVLGFFLPRFASWVTTLAWVPFQGPFELVASWSSWWVPYVFAAVGVAVGAAFVAVALYESLRVVVAESGIRVTQDGETTGFDRSEAATVFVDGKELVVLDSASRQVVRAPIEEKAHAVEQVFTSHGYSFVDGDPYESLYQRWVPDTPALPAEINAVMRAREKALEKKSRTDVSELRVELDRLGIVVRDRKSSQYWRPLVRP
ncbi:YqeB family protein [Rhodococcoides yunnanense]|uniref:YqeB family protein n=1 Tax=Rhodococcoides yunnanense TaxID=278209 RepID=UPI000935372A|nr:hypothetical protein [Rhodococcus yunnanensis]